MLSLPWERVSLTSKANPILASHAPSVRIMIGGNTSILVASSIDMVRIMKVSVRASRLRRQLSRLFADMVIVTIGIMIIMIRRRV